MIAYREYSFFSLKYHATKKKDDMFERLETDVELAIADYNNALDEEDKAEVDNRRQLFIILKSFNINYVLNLLLKL